MKHRCAQSGKSYRRIYDVVRQIPAGRVSTYGRIAAMIGTVSARMVGYAMAALPYGTDVPWHRVINSKGEISLRNGGDGDVLQRALLEAEGIFFDSDSRIRLSRYEWPGHRADEQRGRKE